MDSKTSHSNLHASSVTLDSVRITLELYRSGKSGIPFSALLQFTTPILTHYQLELDYLFDQDVTADNVEDVMLLLDLLEIASAFWDYCSLSENRKTAAFNDLRASLLGPDPSQEDATQFPILLAAMEDAWENLIPSLKELPVQSGGFETGERTEPGVFEAPSSNGIACYGDENLELPEAFALFARPLLDNDLLFDDPDALDDVMAKAQAYWDLAHVAGAHFEKELECTIERLTTPGEPAPYIRAEALRMIERFHELFPERR